MKRKRGPAWLPSQERADADEALARQVSHIVGEHSAASKSLADLARRREQGLKSFLVEIDGSFWVGNWPAVVPEGA